VMQVTLCGVCQAIARSSRQLVEVTCQEHSLRLLPSHFASS
jgi:hypothetical protein